MTNEVRSVARALEILSAFSIAHPRLHLSELADAVGLPRPSVRRLAVTLIERDFLRQDADGTYLLGPRLLELGGQVAEGSAIARRTRDAADELARRTGETVLVAEVDWDRLSLLIIGKRHPVRPAAAVTSAIGNRFPLASGCLAKAVLSGLSPEGAAAIVPKLRLTPRRCPGEPRAGVRDAVRRVPGRDGRGGGPGARRRGGRGRGGSARVGAPVPAFPPAPHRPVGAAGAGPAPAGRGLSFAVRNRPSWPGRPGISLRGVDRSPPPEGTPWQAPTSPCRRTTRALESAAPCSSAGSCSCS
jgi:DNA-binding IclR family transcriptional regulator